MGDSTGEGLPAEIPGVRWVKAPGASVFDLRAQATGLARGQIIAWTEDHCRPAADWCERILAAHAAHPEALAVGGAVTNGSTGHLMDWANFLTTFGPFLPPLDKAKIGRVPPAANISFKRNAVPAGTIESGGIELRVERRLWSMGSIVLDDRIQVTHIQSHGITGTPKSHFHNGRSTSGLVVGHLSIRQRLKRFLICLVLPAEILRTVIVPVAGKREVPLWRCLPLIAVLAFSHALGEMAGIVLNGPGLSPQRLE